MSAHNLRDFFEAVRTLTSFSERYVRGLPDNEGVQIDAKRAAQRKVRDSHKLLIELLNNAFGSKDTE